MTYEELIELAYGNDQYDSIASRGELIRMPNGIYIQGVSTDGEYRGDLYLILHQDSRITVYTKDPENHDINSPIAEGYGSEWDDGFTGTWDEVHTWIYEN